MPRVGCTELEPPPAPSLSGNGVLLLGLGRPYLALGAAEGGVPLVGNGP